MRLPTIHFVEDGANKALCGSRKGLGTSDREYFAKVAFLAGCSKCKAKFEAKKESPNASE